MLTVCPKCALTLAVTAADLRVGQGYVRCGRCATVFNALLALTDASTLELPGSESPPTAREPAAGGAAAAGRASPPADTPAADDTLVHAEDDADEITIDPSLASAPLDLVLEQTSSASPGNQSAAPEFVLPPANDDGVEEIDIDLGSPTFEADAHERTDDTGQRYAMAQLDGEAAAVAASRGIEVDATGTVQTIVMEGTSVLHREEYVDIDTIDSEIAAATRRALEAEARKSIAALDHDGPLTDTGSYPLATPGGAAPFASAAASAPPAAAGTLQGVPAANLEGTGTATVAVAVEPVETRLSESGSFAAHERNPLLAPRTPPPKPPPSLLLWSTFAAALLLILGAQAIHFWRNDIALRNDWISQTLTRIYGVLGLPLTPNWDLRGYDVRQLGAATNGNGDNAIRVRIRLTNRAMRAQPFPVLRLSLYDRYGKKVAARDLQPRDYLPKDRANGMMPVSQQIDSEVAVMDPGPNASSFELDVCMPGTRGLRCASDSPLRPATRPASRP
jgi:predicted Zn finger-like uncharacterized protein